MRQGAPQLAWLLLTLYTCSQLLWQNRGPVRPAAVRSSSSSGREEGCQGYPGPAAGPFAAGAVPVDPTCLLVPENGAASIPQARALGPAGSLGAWCSWAPPAALLLLPSPNLVLGLAHLLAAQILLWGILVPTWRSQPPAAARVAAVHCTLRLVLPLAHLAAAGWDLWQQQQQQQQEQPQADGVPPAAVHVLGGAGWSGRLGVECSLQALLLQLPPQLQLLVGAAEVLMWQAMWRYHGQARPGGGAPTHHPQQLLLTWCLGYVVPLAGVLGWRRFCSSAQPPPPQPPPTAAAAAAAAWKDDAAHTKGVSAGLGSSKIQPGTGHSSSSSSSMEGSVGSRPMQQPATGQRHPHHRHSAVAVAGVASGAGQATQAAQPGAAAAAAGAVAASGKAAAAAGAALLKCGGGACASVQQGVSRWWDRGQPPAALSSPQGYPQQPPARHNSASHITMLLKVQQAAPSCKVPSPPPPQPAAAATMGKTSPAAATAAAAPSPPPAAAAAAATLKMSAAAVAAAAVLASLHVLLLVPQQLCRRWQLLRAAAVPGSVLLLADVVAPKQLQQQSHGEDEEEEEEGREAPGYSPAGPHLQVEAFRDDSTWTVPLLLAQPADSIVGGTTTSEPTVAIMSAANGTPTRSTSSSSSSGCSTSSGDGDDSLLDSCQGLESSLAAAAEVPQPSLVTPPHVLVSGVLVFDTLQQLEQAHDSGALQQLLVEAAGCSGTKAVAIAATGGGRGGGVGGAHTWQTSLWVHGVVAGQQAAVAPLQPPVTAAAAVACADSPARCDGQEACRPCPLPSRLRVVVCQGFRVLLDQQLSLSADSVVCQVALGSPEVTLGDAGAAAACSIHLLPHPLVPGDPWVEAGAGSGGAQVEPATETGGGRSRSRLKSSSSSSSSVLASTEHVSGSVGDTATAAASAAAEAGAPPVWVPTQVTLLLLPEAVASELVTWVVEHQLSLGLVTPLMCDLALLLDAHQQLQQSLSTQLQQQQQQQVVEEVPVAAAGTGMVWPDPAGQLSLGQLAAGTASDLGAYLESAGLAAAADLVARVKQQLLMRMMALQPHAAAGQDVVGVEALTPLLLPTTAAITVLPQAGHHAGLSAAAAKVTEGTSNGSSSSSSSSSGGSNTALAAQGTSSTAATITTSTTTSSSSSLDSITGPSPVRSAAPGTGVSISDQGANSSSSNSMCDHQQPPASPLPAAPQLPDRPGTELACRVGLSGTQAVQVPGGWGQVWRRLRQCMVAGLVLAVALVAGALLQGVASQ